MWRFFQGIAPGSMPPAKRLPMTRSAPALSCSRNGMSREKS